MHGDGYSVNNGRQRCDPISDAVRGLLRHLISLVVERRRVVDEELGVIQALF